MDHCRTTWQSNISQRDCKRNFNQIFICKVACPIHNSTFQALADEGWWFYLYFPTWTLVFFYNIVWKLYLKIYIIFTFMKYRKIVFLNCVVNRILGIFENMWCLMSRVHTLHTLTYVFYFLRFEHTVHTEISSVDDQSMGLSGTVVNRAFSTLHGGFIIMDT